MYRYLIKLSILNTGLSDLLEDDATAILQLKNPNMEIVSKYIHGTRRLTGENTFEFSLGALRASSSGIMLEVLVEHDTKKETVFDVSAGTFEVTVRHSAGRVSKTLQFHFESLNHYSAVLGDYYLAPIEKLSFQVFVGFCVWFFLHATLFFVQAFFGIFGRRRRPVESNPDQELGLLETPVIEVAPKSGSGEGDSHSPLRDPVELSLRGAAESVETGASTFRSTHALVFDEEMARSKAKKFASESYGAQSAGGGDSSTAIIPGAGGASDAATTPLREEGETEEGLPSAAPAKDLAPPPPEEEGEDSLSRITEKSAEHSSEVATLRGRPMVNVKHAKKRKGEARRKSGKA